MQLISLYRSVGKTGRESTHLAQTCGGAVVVRGIAIVGGEELVEARLQPVGRREAQRAR